MFNQELLAINLANKKLSMEDLAEIIGVSKATLSNKIKDGGRFTHSEEEKMIAVFGKKEALAFLYSDSEQ